MKERRLDVYMTTEEFGAFKNAIEQGESELNHYINQYIKEHKENRLEHNDVLSLALIQALENNSTIELTRKILSTKHNGNILTTVNELRKSPVTTMLASIYFTEENLQAFEEYLKEKGDGYPKTELKDKSFLKMRPAMYAPIHNTMDVSANFYYLREHLLDYIYTPESLNQFESTFLAENFNPNEYEELGHDKFFQQWKSKSVEGTDNNDATHTNGHESKRSWQQREDEAKYSKVNGNNSNRSHSPRLP